MHGCTCTAKACTAWLQQRPSSRPGEITLRIMVDLWRFARHRKKFWLVPLMVMAVVYGALAVFTKGSVLAPFIYTLSDRIATSGRSSAVTGGASNAVDQGSRSGLRSVQDQTQ